ncbi:Protein CBG15883 [Caenorhabditis briggsae]|uniref:T20D4.11-like domain-containing protein n=2 Tax=Caenorhabditis briggsae TaxID=6238 RepID=A0AAE9F3H8_CAEBR|nr:Protein CBG15883 [Caenorhabditis briggsae]ULT92005.1 hypothetical protein L3Y34_009595 [Caenorhabditis briggsae]UMM37761.1 hypothetical protein L5515_009427 [Caenorhabditis briggsae]CAP34026.1 Protein CBG15883 [Caenorhabditis briggsae]
MFQKYFPIFLFSLAAGASLEDCKTITLGLEPILKSIEVGDRFFRSPEEYKAYADKCEEIINCVTAADASKLPDLLKKVSPCLFYTFYNRDFSECAHKLIAKKDDNIDCLNTLFNDIHEPEVDECEQWDGLQPCVKEQIEKICDAKILEEYVKQEKNLRPEFCD